MNTDLPTHCRECGDELLFRAPGRDLCARHDPDIETLLRSTPPRRSTH